ncbi:MAG: hypothetical protein NUV98_04590 [Candidatus Roizmanbacteria bacterium]|nr:hypothetical protein [Candidatus Roizmanbacteria bacterium]
MLNTLIPIVKAVGETLKLPDGQYLSWVAKTESDSRRYQLIVSIALYQSRENDSKLKVKHLDRELVIRGKEVYRDYYIYEGLFDKSSSEAMIDYVVAEFKKPYESYKAYNMGIRWIHELDKQSTKRFKLTF